MVREKKHVCVLARVVLFGRGWLAHGAKKAVDSQDVAKVRQEFAQGLGHSVLVIYQSLSIPLY